MSSEPLPATRVHVDELPDTRALPVTPEVPGYTVGAELGRGGMGVVYHAEQMATGRAVALKVLLAGALASSKQRRRFEREVDLAASLRHPHIVTVYDGGVTPAGLPYVALEFLAGQYLTAYLAQTAPALPDLLRLFTSIVRAVQYAHQRGVLHRDLKPGNLLIDAEGQPHLLDFGLARSLTSSEESASMTHTGEFIGTPAYASPEQAAGDVAALDIRTDVYALGVILYEAVAGQMPYALDGPILTVLHTILNTPPDRLRTRSGTKYAIDERLEAIILKALAKTPAERYQSAAAFADDLDSYLAGRPIHARPASVGQLLWLWLRQNLRLAGGVTAIGIVSGLLSALGLAMMFVPRWVELGNACYDAFPSQARPWILSWPVPSESVRGVVYLLGWLAFLGMGWAAVSWAKPRSRASAVTIGSVTGSLAGAVAFVVFIGWLGISGEGHVNRADLRLLAAAHSDPGRIASVYPDLAGRSPAEQASLLARKMNTDRLVSLPWHLWGYLGASIGLFSLVGLVEGYWGYLLNHERHSAAQIVLFFEMILLAILFGSWLLPPLGVSRGLLLDYQPDRLRWAAGVLLLVVLTVAQLRTAPWFVRWSLIGVMGLHLHNGNGAECHLVPAWIEVTVTAAVLLVASIDWRRK